MDEKNYLKFCIFIIKGYIELEQLFLLDIMHLGPVWLEVLKFNKHCSTFVLFDKKFLILD
jgi:hypothetical protein